MRAVRINSIILQWVTIGESILWTIFIVACFLLVSLLLFGVQIFEVDGVHSIVPIQFVNNVFHYFNHERWIRLNCLSLHWVLSCTCFTYCWPWQCVAISFVFRKLIISRHFITLDGSRIFVALGSWSPFSVAYTCNHCIAISLATLKRVWGGLSFLKYPSRNCPLIS